MQAPRFLASTALLKCGLYYSTIPRISYIKSFSYIKISTKYEILVLEMPKLTKNCQFLASTALLEFQMLRWYL